MITNKTLFIPLVIFFIAQLCAAKSPVKQTPYGEKSFSDDDATSKYLRDISLKSGDDYLDSVNTTIIIDVAEVADGALADMIGGICMMDLKNKTQWAVKLYLSSRKGQMQPYLQAIAVEFYLMQYENNEKRLIEFNRYIESLFETKLTAIEEATLCGMVEVINYELRRCLEKDRAM